MIDLFNIPNYIIDTSKFNHFINGDIVEEFTGKFCKYVGYEYGCPLNSATSGILLLSKIFNSGTYTIPTMIPPVVPNAITTAGANFIFIDDTNWIGNSYILYEDSVEDITIIDSAQEVFHKYLHYCKTKDIAVIYSFYPTKPIGSCDGGMICSNNKNLIEHLRILSNNGTDNYQENSWNKKTILPGYKMYMNSIQAYIALQNLQLLEYKKQRLNDIRTYYVSYLGYSYTKHNGSEHLFTIFVDNRDDFINTMKENGISCGIHYQCAHKNPIYNRTHQYLLKSECNSKHIVSIPFHEKLTQKELDHIIKCVKSTGLMI